MIYSLPCHNQLRIYTYLHISWFPHRNLRQWGSWHPGWTLWQYTFQEQVSSSYCHIDKMTFFSQPPIGKHCDLLLMWATGVSVHSQTQLFGGAQEECNVTLVAKGHYYLEMFIIKITNLQTELERYNQKCHSGFTKKDNMFHFPRN